MRSRSILKRVLMLATVLALAGGATGQSCSLSNLGKGTGGDQPVFVATLAVRDAAGADTDIFDVGESVTLVLTVRNRMNSQQTATFTTSRTSDFVVVKDGTADVLWQQSGGQAGTTTGTVATQVTFAARETKTFTATWNQTDNGGNQLDEGTYEVRGALVYDGFDSNPLALNETGSTPVEFTISRINR
jgi:hypothetical protein